MKFSPLVAAIFLAASPGAMVSAHDPAPAGPQSGSVPAPPRPLRLDKVPLGNAVRMVSARFRTTITITANYKAPISGDFSSMDLSHTLAEFARQAGLAVKLLGPDPGAGYALCKPEEVSKLSEANEAVCRDMTPSAVKSTLDDAEKKREELLKERAELQAKYPQPPPQP